MVTQLIKQEILLVITVSGRELSKKELSEGSSNMSHAEQLEEACWNGLLDEFLSGIVERSVFGKRLSVWNIRQGHSFLEIELCDYPQSIETYLSIDPYIFLQTISQN
jgi:hypothetical protein